MRSRVRHLFLHILALSALSACGGGDGGGGGNSNEPPTTPPSTPPTTVMTGTAAKGLLANAPVAVFEVSSTGTVGSSPLGTSRTNGAGVFEVSVASNNPVVVTVTTDAETRMLDELSGVSAPAPGGLTMHTALAAPTTTPIAVTPLTEMAFGIARTASGGLTTANIDAANSTVSVAMLGGAPVQLTLPVDLADYKTVPVASQAQAKLLTALAVAADEGTATGANGAPCSDADYDARIVCMVGGLTALIIPGASSSAQFAANSAYLLSAYEKINKGLVTVLGGQAPSQLGLDVPTVAEQSLVAALSEGAILLGYNADATPLENTKALFADLRTNVVSLQEGVDVFGVSPTVDALGDDYQSNVAPVLVGTRDMIAAAYTAMGLIENAVPGSYERSSGHGVCAYDPATLGTDANVALCRFGSDSEEQFLLKATETVSGSYAITTQPLTISFDPAPVPGPEDPIYRPYIGVSYTVSDTIPSLSGTFTWATSASGAISASWSGPYYVTWDGGNISGELAVSQSDDWDPDTISGTLHLSGRLADGAGGVDLVEAVVADGSSVVVRNALLVEGIAPYAEASLELTRLETAAFIYAVKASIERPVYDSSNSVAVPTEASVTGSVSQIGGDGLARPLFDGSIGLAILGVDSFDATQPIGPDNSFVAQLQITGTVALSGSRVLTITVAANGSQLDPSPAAPYSLTATYAYTTPVGVARINVSATYDSIQGIEATVTTNSGVTAIVTRPVRGDVSGTVDANGVRTATINGITINYSDGTTESLF
jgi:hypothetical protein